MFFYRSYRHRRRKRLLTMLLPLIVLVILLLPFYCIYKPPYLLIRYFQHRWPDVLWQVQLKPTSPPLVALTLDDAPSEFTPEILALLRANDATATFFVIGDHIEGREDVLHDLVQNGNELANHAMHDEPSRDLSDDDLAAQIQAVQSRIQRIYAAEGRGAEAHEQVHIQTEDANNHNNPNTNAFPPDSSSRETGHGPGPDPDHNLHTTTTTTRSNHGPGGGAATERGVVGGDVATKYFRPGSGFFTDRMRALVQRLGFRIVLGSVYPHDPQISVPWLNAGHILSMVRPGSIIVVHDRRPWTAPTLAKVLPELKRRGYRVGTLTDLLKESVS